MGYLFNHFGANKIMATILKRMFTGYKKLPNYDATWDTTGKGLNIKVLADGSPVYMIGFSPEVLKLIVRDVLNEKSE